MVFTPDIVLLPYHNPQCQVFLVGQALRIKTSQQIQEVLVRCTILKPVHVGKKINET